MSNGVRAFLALIVLALCGYLVGWAVTPFSYSIPAKTGIGVAVIIVSVSFWATIRDSID